MSLVPTMGSAMVLLTSGIVDEAPCRRAGSSSVLPTEQSAGVEPGATSHQHGTDTLLSFEESGRPSGRVITQLPFPGTPRGCCRGLVSLHLINWIVDASIL